MKSSLLSRINQWWADLPLRWKGATVLLIPVTALICGFASVYLVGLKETDAEMWVFHTSAVRYNIRVVLYAVVDAETAVRGFVISRDPQFLDLYHTSQQTFPRSAHDLTKLVSENSEQMRRLIEIKQLAEARFNLLSQVVDAVNNNDSTQISQRVFQLIGRERKLMDELRSKITAIDDEEMRVQDRRNRELQADRRLSDNVICLSAMFGVLCGVAGMVLFGRGIVRQIKKIQTNAERLAKETSLEPEPNRRDEIGGLGRRLVEASNLLQAKQRALRDSEARLQAVLDNAPSVMYVKDLEGRFVLANRAFATLLKRSINEIVGRTGHDLYPEEEADIFRANDLAALEAGRPMQTEETLECKDGMHTFISSKFPLRDSNGKAYALGGISTDITERARNAAALAAAKAEAERASQVKSAFLSRMSHELRTPLHAILGFAQLLRRKTKPNREHEYVDQILHAGDHLLELINEVLEISYLRSNSLVSSANPIEPREVAAKEPALVSPAATK